MISMNRFLVLILTVCNFRLSEIIVVSFHLKHHQLSTYEKLSKKLTCVCVCVCVSVNQAVRNVSFLKFLRTY